MTKKTVHGCKCIKDWIKINGKIESGCIYGGVESKVCPATKDRRNVTKENCHPGDLTAWCEVQKGCGYTPDIDQDENISDYRKKSFKKVWRMVGLLSVWLGRRSIVESSPN